MTSAELLWAMFLWVVGLSGIWQLATWAECGIRYACDHIERRVALRHLRQLTDAAMRQPAPPDPLPQPIQLVMPAKEFVTYWNGITIRIDSSIDEGKLALLGVYLGRFDWHRRPTC